MAYDHETDSIVAPSPRRVRRRRRARVAFWVVFTIIVLAGVGAVAALFGGGSDGSSTGSPGDVTSADGGTGAAATTTTTAAALPPAKPFKVTDGVNVREGPGTSYRIVGTIETGYEVLVVCVIDGETVDGPSGPTNKWVRVVFNDLKGYVTNQYVATGAAVNDPNIIGYCTDV
jgi:hypothetical protein